MAVSCSCLSCLLKGHTLMALDIVRQRLHNQFLSHPDFTEPSQVVETLGAVQSQDYSGGKWALGLRMNGATDAAIDQAFNEGKILRTHILRPTWHFVAPQDIRWMLKLTAPRVVTHHGTLEDVFMSLTGRHLREDD